MMPLAVLSQRQGQRLQQSRIGEAIVVVQVVLSGNGKLGGRTPHRLQLSQFQIQTFAIILVSHHELAIIIIKIQVSLALIHQLVSMTTCTYSSALVQNGCLHPRSVLDQSRLAPQVG